MNLEARIRDGEGSAVDRTDVERHWLEMEVDDDVDVSSLDDEEVREALFDRKPVAAEVFEERSLTWYRLSLETDDFRELRPVQGPPNQGWRALCPNDRLRTVAERIEDAEEIDDLQRDTPKDVEQIVSIADDLPGTAPMDPFILVKDDEEPPFVADGNHRAVAFLLHHLREDGCPDQEAYVGVDES